MADWLGIAQTTIQDYLKGAEDTIMRNRKLLAKLKSAGRVIYGAEGKALEWRVKYKRAPVQTMQDGGTLTFARINRHKTASLDYRGYATTDAVTKKEKLMNKGRSAIIQRFVNCTEELVSDIEENFGDELYVDGNLAGNEARIHGMESFFGTTAASVSGTCAVNPSDSYANINTDLGNYGGTWTGNWPTGKGSPEYDFFTPLIVDTTCTLAAGSGGWTSATKTFAANAREQMRFALINTRKNKSKKGAIDTVMLDSIYFRQFAESLDSKERIVIERGRPNSLVSMGYDDVVNFEGAELTYEYGMAAKTGYGFNTNFVELYSLQDQLFVPEGPDFDIAGQNYRFAVDMYGNLKFYSPRNFFKLAEFGYSGA